MTTQQVSESTAVIARVFGELAAQWASETAFLSDSGKAAAHPMYRALIALGPQVVPFMLRDLQSEEPNHWFIALEEITGENPIPSEHYGKIRQMAADWVGWGRRHGYVT